MPLLTVLFSFNGRIGRQDFWLKGIIPSIAAHVIVYLVALAIPQWDTGFGLISIVFMWMYFAVYAKRWHDLDKSGWWSLLALIPFVGTFGVPLWLGIKEGMPDPNQYGFAPGSQEWHDQRLREEGAKVIYRKRD